MSVRLVGPRRFRRNDINDIQFVLAHHGDDILVVGNTTGVIEAKVNELRALQENGDMLEVDASANGQTITLTIPGKIRTNDKLYKVVDA